MSFAPESWCTKFCLLFLALRSKFVNDSYLRNGSILRCAVHTQTTAGGIILTTTGTKQIHDALVGKVLAVGEDVKVGDLKPQG